jgi:predicted Fe-Mo cluster-binding NifX family protein
MRTRKIGIPLLRAGLEAPLAEHLPSARWLLVYQAPDRYELIRNLEADGLGVADLFASSGCSDVIVGQAAPGALSQLAASRIEVWQGEMGAAAQDLADRLGRGELAAIRMVPPDRSGGDRGLNGRLR